SEVEAFLLEAVLVKKYQPFYNIQLLDDKSYPHIKVFGGSDKQPPYITITRKLENDGSEYFGPYTNTGDVKIILKLLRRIFPYQSVINHPKRPCLYNHLGLCPCIPAFPENLEKYKKNISKIKQFLNGKQQTLMRTLKKEQKEA